MASNKLELRTLEYYINHTELTNKTKIYNNTSLYLFILGAVLMVNTLVFTMCRFIYHKAFNIRSARYLELEEALYAMHATPSS